MAMDRLTIGNPAALYAATQHRAPRREPGGSPAIGPVGFARDGYLPAAERPTPQPLAADECCGPEMRSLRARLADLQQQLAELETQLDDVREPIPAERGSADAVADDPLPADMPGMSHDPNDVAGIERMFVEADENQDGAVDFTEMVAHEEGDVAKASLHLGDADRDADGGVTKAEWIWHHQNSPLHSQTEPIMAPRPGT